MKRLLRLKHKVVELYDAQRPERTDWADWLFAYHVPFVAEHAAMLASKYGANPELAEAAAWLHDIADVKLDRMDKTHEAESLRMAREILEQTDYTKEEIAIVVDDAIKLHSCYDGVRPASPEGQVLATADALAHLTTDFYVYTTWALGGDMAFKEVKAWALKKMERDFKHKICFDEVREATRSDYDRLKTTFSR